MADLLARIDALQAQLDQLRAGQPAAGAPHANDGVGVAVGPGVSAVPTRFSTGNIVEWIRKFEVCATANGWNAEAQIRRLPTFLDGQAFAVFERLGRSEERRV